MLNITKNGQISDGDRTSGVEYLSDEDAINHLRDIEFEPLLDSQGRVLAKSMHAVTDEEKSVVQKQKIMFGEFAGKTLEDREREIHNGASE